jgi:drug/metabolite transporter (DMT)-like permease
MSYADREIIVSGFTLGLIAIFIGCILQFSPRGPLNHFGGYALVACGVVLLFLSYLARVSRRNVAMLRILLMGLTLLLLAGVLLKDVIDKLV